MSERADQIERRGRRRPASAASAAPVVDRSRSYRHLTNPFEPLKVFSDDHVAAIHEAALSILENNGMRVLLPEAIEPSVVPLPSCNVPPLMVVMPV